MKWISFRNSSVVSILVSNLLLLIATIVFKWDGLGVFILYIIETVIIAIYHVFKLFIIGHLDHTNRIKVEGAPGLVGTIATVLFFMFHFGFFLFIQTMLILPMKSGSFIKTFTSINDYLGGENRWLVIAFFIINFYSLIKYIFIDDAYEGKTFQKIFMEPYPRIFVQQFVVIIGSGILMILGSSLAFVLFFIFIKTIIELNVDLFTQDVK
ncbi:MAG: DUF6498-containing protein [Chitinophagales bacterium]